MICTVHGIIPDKYVACPGCTEDQSRGAMRRYQHHALRLVADGQPILFTTRMVDKVRHVQMFGPPESPRAFCGAVQIQGHHRRGAESLKELDANHHGLRAPVCLKCRSEIAAITAEAVACSA